MTQKNEKNAYLNRTSELSETKAMRVIIGVDVVGGGQWLNLYSLIKFANV